MTAGRYRTEQDLLDKVIELEKRLSALERTPQASNVGVNTGGITLKGGSLRTERPNEDPFNSQGTISIGSNIGVNGEAGMSISVNRSNAVPGANTFEDGTIVTGETAMTVATVDGTTVDPTFTFPTIQLRDKSGSPVFGDSRNARRGMTDPIMHQTWQPGTYINSTSGTFAFIMSSECYLYHPHIRIRVLVQNDVGSSSELRVSENGGNNNIMTVTMGSGAFQYQDLVVARSLLSQGNGNNGNIAAMNLEHRRSAGAGTIRTQIMSVVGIDLSWFNFY